MQPCNVLSSKTMTKHDQNRKLQFINKKNIWCLVIIIYRVAFVIRYATT